MSSRLRIGTRLSIGFGFLVVLLVALSWFSIREVNRLDENLTIINERNSVLQRYAINYRGSVHDRAISVRDVVLVTTEQARSQAVDTIARLADAYAANRKFMAEKVARVGASDAEKAILAEIDAIESRTNPLVARIIEFQRAGRSEEARTVLLGEASPLFDDWLRTINRFIDHQEASNNAIGAQVKASAGGYQNIALVALLIAVALAMAAAVLVSRSITRPIESLCAAMRTLADGHVDVVIDGESRTDEIGEMARTVVVFQKNAIARAELEEAAKADYETNRDRQAQLTQAIGKFNAVVSESLSSVKAGTLSMAMSAEALTGVASDAVGRAQAAKSASTNATSAVQHVASAAEQLSASIREIADLADRVSGVVQHANAVAQSTDAKVEGLTRSAEKIGDVIELIRSIADQTNLLALNATIEAARAGDAGKGFAVVAQEVKALASQTSKATAEIAQQIGAVQGSTRESVEAIREIGGAVREIGSFTQAITNSVREQDAATKEISQSIAGASLGSQEATRNVELVTTVIDETSGEAAKVFAVSETLSTVSSDLSRAVEEFLQDVSQDRVPRARRA